MGRSEFTSQKCLSNQHRSSGCPQLDEGRGALLLAFRERWPPQSGSRTLARPLLLQRHHLVACQSIPGCPASLPVCHGITEDVIEVSFPQPGSESLGLATRSSGICLVGIVCFLVSLVVCSVPDLPRALQTSRSGAERRRSPFVLCPYQERVRANHGVGTFQKCDGYGDMVLRDSKWRRVPAHTRVSPMAVTLRSDGPHAV